MGQADLIHRDSCRLCGLGLLKDVINLTATPPANSYIHNPKTEPKQTCFPLTVTLCESCGHTQLREVVNPSLLFKSYLYVSGTSPVYREHLKNYAHDMNERFTLNPDQYVVEIGSNDGQLLAYFQESSIKTLGIDPADNLAKSANDKGITTIADFFSPDLAKQVLQQYGAVQLVVANHVFAHIDDLSAVVDGVDIILDEKGSFVFEVGYFLDVFQNHYFDTIYHEHVSFHTVKPLVQFFKSKGMTVFDVERNSAQGGSIRVFVQKQRGAHNALPSVAKAIAEEEEMGLFEAGTFTALNASIQQSKEDLQGLLQSMKQQGKKIAAFGAPAKATTLMYHFDLNSSVIDYIIDDNPLKQGLYTPGLHIPICSRDEALENPADILVVLAWNFADSIMNSMTDYRASGGQFIIPFPDVKLVSQ